MDDLNPKLSSANKQPPPDRGPDREVEWYLNVQGERIKSDRPTIAVREAMAKAGFDPTQRWHIFLKVAGQPKKEVELDTIVCVRQTHLAHDRC